MKVINMVATAIVNKPFDLDQLKNALKGSERAASGPKWLKMRLPKGNQYVAFYQSGKFLITGVKSLKDIDTIVQKVSHLLAENGIEVKVKAVKVHNVVVSDKLDIDTPLEKIIIEYNELTASYEPEQFPALIIQGKGCTYLLFSSGKIICTGNKSIEEADKNIKWLKGVLKDA